MVYFMARLRWTEGLLISRFLGAVGCEYDKAALIIMKIKSLDVGINILS